MRFGKYTGLRSDPNKVAIFVNGKPQPHSQTPVRAFAFSHPANVLPDADQEVDFCMHMGRTGEAYFIVDAEPGMHDSSL